MEENIRHVLEFVKEKGTATFPFILKNISISLSTSEAKELQRIVLGNKLLEPTEEDGHQYGPKMSYMITEKGLDFIDVLDFNKRLDKLLNWLVQDFAARGNKGSYYDTKEICKNTGVEYSLEYAATLLSNHHLETVSSKDGSAFKVRERFYPLLLNIKTYYVNEFMKQYLKKPSQSHMQQPIQNFTTNFHGESKGNISIGGQDVRQRFEAKDQKKKPLQIALEVLGTIVTLAGIVWGIVELVT
jgi:hypothetical protein